MYFVCVCLEKGQMKNEAIRDHRELILEGKCDKTPGQKIKQYIYLQVECIQLRPVQATKNHLVDSISVYSNIVRCTVLPTESLIV